MWDQNVSLVGKVASNEVGMLSFGLGTLQVSVLDYDGIEIQMKCMLRVEEDVD